MNPTTLMHKVMLACQKVRGVTIFRNNTGVATYPDGARVAYGLTPGASDLIGWKTITVTPELIGQDIAVFLAIEVKAGSGMPTKKQRNFLQRVREAGGIAFVARSPAEIKASIYRVYDGDLTG